MSTDCVTATDFLLIFWLRNSFRQKCYTGFMKLCSSPFKSMIVFWYCSWSFFTFNNNSWPLLHSFFFLKFWLSLSKNYKRRFALTWALSPPSFHKFAFWWTPLSLSQNVIIQYPLIFWWTYFWSLQRSKQSIKCDRKNSEVHEL